MNRKSKSFIEDTLVLIVVCGLIYGIYTFFFTSEEQTNNSFENQATIEQSINTQKESIVDESTKSIENKDKATNEIKDDTKELEKTTSSISTENIKLKEVERKKEIKEIKKEDKEMIPVISTDKTIDSLYKTIEQRIYSNILKNVNKDTQNNLSDVNIRITILQDGKYEQLTYMEGNRQYYELIKSSILEVFPIKIDDSLKVNFPRYFRMKVKY